MKLRLFCSKNNLINLPSIHINTILKSNPLSYRRNAVFVLIFIFRVHFVFVRVSCELTKWFIFTGEKDVSLPRVYRFLILRFVADLRMTN